MLPRALLAIVGSALVFSGCVGDSPVGPADAAVDAGGVQDAMPSQDTGSPMDAAVEAAGPDAGDAAAGFSVKNLPGIALWLDAAKGVVNDGNQKVSTWSDQSGNSNDATQSLPGNQPTLGAQTINGMAAIHFVGGQDLEIADSASLQLGTGDFFIAVVARWTNVSGFAQLYGKKEPLNPYNGAGMWGNYPTNGLVGGETQTGLSVASTTSSLNDNVARQYAVRRSGSTLSLRVNGKTEGTTANATSDCSAVGTKAYIGQNGGSQYPLDGDIAELVVIKGSISGTDLTALETYLANKYKL